MSLEPRNLGSSRSLTGGMATKAVSRVGTDPGLGIEIWTR